MLNQRIINTATGAGAACTTDTVQILDGVPFQSIATYELDGDATNLVDTGYIGKAGVFNGSSSYVDLGNSAFQYTSLTISTWIYPTAASTVTILQNYESGGSPQNSGWFLRLNSDGTILFGGYGSGGYGLFTTSTVSLNTWTNVTVTFSPTSSAIYFNGVAQSTSSSGWSAPYGTIQYSTGGNNNGNPTSIGRLDYTGGSSQYFTGSIDQLRIFDRVLTSSEVTTLSQETSASSTKSTTDIFGDSSGISLYELESNANDTSGTNNGTATNVVYNEYDGTASNVTYSTGKFGQAGVFNGSSSYINYDNFTFPANDFTFSAWANTNNVASQYNMITTIAKSGSGFMYLTFEYNKLFYYDGGSTVSLASSVGSISNNTWYHCLITKSSTDGIKLYLNGNLVGSNAATTSNPTNGTGQNRIGHYYTPTSIGHFNGSIDQVRIYDKAISAADVTTLYNETAATASTNITLEVPSLVAYYKMNDATDETGSYDGTPTNVNFNVAGKFGNAGEFNGGNSIITLANTPSLSQANNFTWSYWVKPNGFTANGTVFRLTSHSYTSHEIRSNGIIFFYWGNGNSLTTSSGVITDGVWQHVAITKSSTSGVVIYVNGVSVATSSNTDNAEATTATNRIGGWDGTNYGFLGSLDQVRIFDRAITANEVETLYNEVYCQPTIVPTDHFEPVIYTGNGSSQSISTLDFAPDFVWIKERNNPIDHLLFDVVRGAGVYQRSNLASNDPAPQLATLSSFDSNGFSVGTDGGVNGNNDTYVAWNWKAGGADVQNTDGTITSQVSANTDAGFSIVKWTGTSAINTIGHGIDTPQLILIKCLGGSDWQVYSEPTGNGNKLALNLSSAASATTRFDSTSPTSSVFTFRDVGFPSQNFIAYCFHSVDGMSKIGSYVGVGSGNTVNVVTGFRPAMIIIKRTDSIEDWKIIDNKRDFANSLEPNESIAEEVGNNSNFSSHSNGFTIGDPHGDYNASGGTYIFMAFAEENVEPQPVLANSFNTVTYTGTGTTGGNTLPVTGFGFQPDLVWIKNRDVAVNHYLYDSVRGTGAAKALHSNATSSESTASVYAVNGGVSSFLSDGFTAYRGTDNTYQGTNMNGQDYVAWAWKASNESTINQEGSITSIVSANPAAGFSVVKHTAPSSEQNYTIGHGLSQKPDMVILKGLDSASSWFVWHKDLSVESYYLYLNGSFGESGLTQDTRIWGQQSFTDTVISTRSNYTTVLNQDYISYCFHSVDGYQKVGSYSGNSTSGRLIQTDFAVSWVMIKTTNASSNWFILDSERGGTNDLRANSNNAEEARANGVTFVSNGFELDDTSVGFNNTGTDYIYLAIKAN